MTAYEIALLLRRRPELRQPGALDLSRLGRVKTSQPGGNRPLFRLGHNEESIHEVAPTHPTDNPKLFSMTCVRCGNDIHNSRVNVWHRYREPARGSLLQCLQALLNLPEANPTIRR